MSEKERLKRLDILSKKAGQAIYDHRMIEPDDRVLVAISGGKDSYVLLEVLADRKKHLPFHFDLEAVHVHLEGVGYQIDLNYANALCQSLAVPLHVVKETVDLNQDPGKSACQVCAWFRRKYIFDLTCELGLNKLALGHHMDDALETLLLNMMYHGSISSMPANLRMFDRRVHLIRPLLFLQESQVISYSSMRDYPASLEKCPHEHVSRRENARELVDKMCQQHPGARLNMFRSMNKILAEYLPQGKINIG
jgi:tRNA 2-thiocytidine biosynthesis protein TtcA